MTNSILKTNFSQNSKCKINKLRKTLFLLTKKQSEAKLSRTPKDINMIDGVIKWQNQNTFSSQNGNVL